MSGGNTQQAATAAERFTAAHDALKADPSVQFTLAPAPPPPQPPAWLKALGEWLTEVLEPVGRFLGWISSFMPDAPYARIYVPEPLRASAKVGDAARVHVEGMETVWQGTVRMIRNDPTFTPYYALTGQDATRLSYLAEVQLGADAATLPAGLPVWVDFGP